TVVVTKGEDGNWTTPAKPGVTVNPETGELTIDKDNVKDGSEVTAITKDGSGNTSEPIKVTAGNDEPTTDKPGKPTVTAKGNGSVTVLPPKDVDVTTIEVTYTNENGEPETVVVTKGEDGNWTTPAKPGVTVNPETGELTIDKDNVKDGSEVTAITKDGSGNTSEPIKVTAGNDSLEGVQLVDSPLDTDGDGIIDSLDDDIDGDGFTNVEELEKGTNPFDKNSKPSRLGSYLSGNKNNSKSKKVLSNTGDAATSSTIAGLSLLGLVALVARRRKKDK
ncbi:LPXTG cell wall anchor domain-containing protein, partial [Gemelliphila palaticanis]